MSHKRPFLFALCLVGLSVTVAACAGSPSSGEDQSAQQSSASASHSKATGSWPRTVVHDAGETEIPAEPTRIVSVAPSLTGSLLAIDAPVIASAGAVVTGMTNDQGFFTQWADVADECGVEVAYPNMELDLDAVDALEPDLIIGSANGGDSALDAYDQLSEIAPTLLIDYGSQTWQDLMMELAADTGRETQAEDVLAEYNTWVAAQAEKIVLPEQPVTAGVYLGADGMWAFPKETPQADLLTSLGFTYVSPVEEYVAPESIGTSVSIISPENMVSALGETKTFLSVDMGTPGVLESLTADPLLANHPAIAEGRLFDMGTAAFRLDYYSAKDTVDLLVETFGD